MGYAVHYQIDHFLFNLVITAELGLNVLKVKLIVWCWQSGVNAGYGWTWEREGAEEKGSLAWEDLSMVLPNFGHGHTRRQVVEERDHDGERSPKWEEEKAWIQHRCLCYPRRRSVRGVNGSRDN